MGKISDLVGDMPVLMEDLRCCNNCNVFFFRKSSSSCDNQKLIGDLDWQTAGYWEELQSVPNI